MTTDLTYGQKVNAYSAIAVSGHSYLYINTAGLTGKLVEALAGA